MKNIALVFAGGVGSRMKTNIPKQFLQIDGKEILIHTLEIFQNNKNIDEIYLVCVESWFQFASELLEKYKINKVINIIPGGKSGQESIYKGLDSISKNEENAIVLIHDGVRPILEKNLIDRNIESVKKYGSSISCAPSKETTVQIDDENMIEAVIDRSKVWLARAPQCFYLNDILKAHQEALRNGCNNVIDSCSMMRRFSDKKLHIVETWAENIKITTPEDFYMAEGLISGAKK